MAEEQGSDGCLMVIVEIVFLPVQYGIWGTIIGFNKLDRFICDYWWIWLIITLANIVYIIYRIFK